MEKIVLITGGFDPIHSGHINYINAARELGDYLVVGLNSDDWLTRKKGQPFMPWEERACVLNAIGIDWIIDFDDNDGSSIDAINKVKERFPKQKIIFANGGDRTAVNIPEMKCKDVIFKFGVGGSDKSNSSSWLLREWKNPKTDRQWGYYRVLHDVPGCKVKELVVEPGQKLSMQKHLNRSELWFVASGQAILNTEEDDVHIPVHKHSYIDVKVGSWHQLYNPYEEPCHVIEIQYGTECVEADIIRL